MKNINGMVVKYMVMSISFVCSSSLLICSDQKVSLLNAVRVGNYNVVQRTITDEVVRRVESGQNTLLLHAVNGCVQQPKKMWAYKKIIALLIAGGSNVIKPDDVGNTPLSLAFANRLWDIARLIVSSVSDVPTRTKLVNQKMGDKTPLCIASFRGNTQTVECLLQSGANAAAMQPLKGYTPLHCAVEKKHRDVVKALINHDPELAWVINAEGLTPVDMAGNNYYLLQALGIAQEGEPKKVVSQQNNSREWVAHHFDYVEDFTPSEQHCVVADCYISGAQLLELSKKNQPSRLNKKSRTIVAKCKIIV